MKAIGIDLGTTTVSAAVIDIENKNVICAKTLPNGSFIHTERSWERIQDADAIVQKARAVLDELLESCPDAVSIGLTGQMHGILYLDGAGRGISPLYTWQDGRGNLAEFDGETLAEALSRQYGIRLAAGYGLVTHLYNLRRGLAPVACASLCTIGDYLGMVLTGRRQPLLHISNAASLGFFDVEHGHFMEEALRQAGMETELLPEVTDRFAVLGTYRGIPVYTAIGDNQASFLGSVGIEENTLLLNMGTGGQISVLSDRCFEAPGIEARPLIKDRYLLVGSSLCGGRAYAVLEKFFRSYVAAAGGEDVPQYAVMERLAEKGALLSDGMKVMTAFNGTRTDPGLRGSISRIKEDNFTPEGLIYGVLEGMARELYDLYGVIGEGTGIRAERIVASGNGLRKNNILRQICSRMFQAGLTLAPHEEEAACGAAVSTCLQSVSRSSI